MKKLIKYRELKFNQKTNMRFKRIFSDFLLSGQYLPGKRILEFEKKISAYCGRKYCIGVSSGSNALYLALKSHNLSKGDEVICPAISWLATANAISMTGATPVFVDVKVNQNIDPNEIKKAINKKTKAIMMVHFKGIIADYEKIKKIANSNSLLIIEDAAQAFGAKINNIIAGNLGNISSFSFNPMKVLQGFGEAGAVLTNSNNIYKKIKKMRHLGVDTKNKEISNFIELNSKIDEIQASLILENLRNLNKEIKIRKIIIKNYISELKKIVIDCNYDLKRSSGYDYQILATKRNKLINFLNEKNIETRIKHPILMADQPTFKKAKKLNLKNARWICKHSLSLPLHRNLSQNDQEYIIDSIKKFYQYN